MAAFTIASAESRIKSKGPAGDRTWVIASGPWRDSDGTIFIDVVRYMAPGAGLLNGGHVKITDDATV